MRRFSFWLVALVSGCHLIGGYGDFNVVERGDGGSTSVGGTQPGGSVPDGGGGTGGGGTGGGGAGPCMDPEDCPAPSEECMVAMCDAGVCGSEPADPRPGLQHRQVRRRWHLPLLVQQRLHGVAQLRSNRWRHQRLHLHRRHTVFQSLSMGRGGRARDLRLGQPKYDVAVEQRRRAHRRAAQNQYQRFVSAHHRDGPGELFRR